MTSTPRHASNNLPQPVEIKILMVWFINTTYFLRILKKLNLTLLVTCQWITGLPNSLESVRWMHGCAVGVWSRDYQNFILSDGYIFLAMGLHYYQ